MIHYLYFCLMINAVIIGVGNVAFHLAKIFYEIEEIHVTQICGRQPSLPEGMPSDIDYCTSYDAILQADIYVIAVSDTAIADVAEQLPFNDRLVVHTAGANSIEILKKHKRRGVFYPLQTFSKNTPISFENIPICVEANNSTDEDFLFQFGKMITKSVYRIDSQERLTLHTAAVFANNFTNYLYQLSEEICNQENVSFDILKPLILETAKKINFAKPKDVQTGPGKRGDLDIIKKHVGSLRDQKHKEIYQLLTKHILSQHGKNIL